MVAPWVLERRSTHETEFRLCLTDWLICEQNQTQTVVDACMLLLEESYLLSLPLPPRVVLPAVPGPRNFRFLFRRHVASLLGWTQRREEGEHHGFSDSVNKFVREIWWPDEGAEALHRAGQSNRQSRAISDPQVLPPVVDVLPTSDTAEELWRCEFGVAKDVPADPVPRSVPVSRGQPRSKPVGMQHQPQTNSEDHGGRALAQGSDAGKLYLDQRELEVKWIAGNASANDAICGGLDGCSAACSRVKCIPVSGSGFRSECATVDNNQHSYLCSATGACQRKVKLNYARSFVDLPPPGSTTLSSEVARDICLQRKLDSTFKTLSVPGNYSELYFGSTSGAFRHFPGREQNETHCTSFDPRWRPWYMSGISVARDLKILVDVGNGMGNQVIPDYYRDVGATYLDVVKSLALSLLQTASPGDDVEVYSFDNATATSLGGTFRVNSTFDFFSPSGHSELGPLVTAVKKLSQSPLTGALSDLNGAILQVASSFNQLKSLKVIVVLSNGLFVVNSTTFPSAELQSNKAKLMVFKLPTNDDGGDTFMLKTSFQEDICSVQGSFESLDPPATLNPLYSLRSFFTYLAGVQLSAVGGQVSWSNAYASVSQDLKAITPTCSAFGSDGLLIGVAGSDVVIDKLDDTLKALVLQDFSRRNRGILQAPANVSMTCFYQVAPAKAVCPNSTPPSSSAICPRNDTSSTLADRTCCDECRTIGNRGLTIWEIVGISVGALAGAVVLIVLGIAFKRICYPVPQFHPVYPGGAAANPVRPGSD